MKIRILWIALNFLASGLSVVAAPASDAKTYPAAANAHTMTADFSVNHGTGHPLIFGVHSQYPAATVFNSMKSAGINFIRSGFEIQTMLPASSVADYKNNVHDVQNPATWNLAKWDKESGTPYHDQGFTVLAVMCYCPSWLSYSEDAYGVPKDWNVYEDIVKKIYSHYKGSVDFVEIWNEPDADSGQFLTLKGAPANLYPNVMEAYKQIYRHAAAAIRSVDPRIPLGGPVLADTNHKAWVADLLNDPTISPNVNFIAYHGYDDGIPNQYKKEQVKDFAALTGKKKLPIIVSEWNYDWHYNENPLCVASPDAISYVGFRLTNLFVDHAFAANMYTEGEWSKSFPLMDNTDHLLPKGAAFRLLSHDLGLGTGDSTIHGAISDPALSAAACATNAAGKKVVWMVNDSSSALLENITLHGLKPHLTVIGCDLFEASARNDATNPVRHSAVSVRGGTATLNHMSVPAKSIVGIAITSEK